MRSWMVRAGAQGEGEHAALMGPFVGIGWPEIGDYSDSDSRADIRALLQVALPDEEPLHGRYAGELLRFKDEIHTGDLVVLPAKTTRNVSIGQVTGPYRHVPANHPQVRNVRTVEWIASDLPWSVFRRDITATLKAQWTVIEIKASRATERLLTIAAAGVDPGPDGRTDVNPPEEVTADESYFEGAVEQVLLNRYERDPAARRACLAIHGYLCVVCGFDFEARYGEYGRGFIHVHHLTPLSEADGGYEVDPRHDLLPVCPNCHAMLHRRRPALSIEALRHLMSI